MKRTEYQRRLPRAYRAIVGVFRPILRVLTKQEWSGLANLPGQGGFIVCPNHVSHTDFLVLGHVMFDAGRPVYFLGKSDLFEMPVVGRLIRAADQIPVYRGTDRAADAYRAAVAAVRAGKAVAMYPEGTLTRDPGTWPMRGKTGAARVALETRCPVIPVTMWGPNLLMGTYEKRLRPFPRKTMHVVVGQPVDLADLYDVRDQRAAAQTATDRIMAALTGTLEGIRGEVAPVVRHDPRAHGQTEFGPLRTFREDDVA